jgi:hypothetical protein
MMDAHEILDLVKAAAHALSQTVMDSANKFTKDQIAKVMPISIDFMAAMSLATAKLVSQEGEIARLKDRIEFNKTANSSSRAIDICDTLAELGERDMRSKNVIMFDVPEAGLDVPVSEHIAEDRKKVAEIIQHVEVLSPEKVVRLQRLGTRQKDKTRPLKITFVTGEDAKAVLYNKSRLPKSIKVKQDYTDIQREHIRKTWSELERRKANGEENIVIKYINGAPKIVKGWKKN